MAKLLDKTIEEALKKGTIIPAHPLALTASLQLDEQYQRLLTKYYIASGAGGIAVGVHTTQFAIRHPDVNLLEPVLSIAAEEISKSALKKPFIKVAGICGPEKQALAEAALANKYEYHLGLLSLGGLNHYSDAALIAHVKAVAAEIPVIGFYLQPAVGGRLLSYEFWRAFAEIPNVKAIKVAAFNRYQTLDVVRAVCNSGRCDDITLYTGNDDNIIADLLTPYRFNINGKVVEKRFVGGLLGHWAVWTQKANPLLESIKKCIAENHQGIETLLAKNVHVTDMNAAIFDSANGFHGCIAGIHEVLYRQGLMRGKWCLDPNETLSPGQYEEINRVCNDYPSLTDDDFVKEFLSTNL
ncbi:MAG: dihydrodipicolinate synthase family protein [Chitinophagaceae bacterium]|nr:MAG: dihydrodipicolinate synthase family protein [Chitinophagaceae bacterium]